MDLFLPPAILPHAEPGGCPTEEDSVWRIQWLAIDTGSIQSARCPGEGNTAAFGLAYRRCVHVAGAPGRGVWDAVDVSECESATSRATRMKVEQMCVKYC